MKNILVICKYFAPVNGIASIRWTKILKYLSQYEELKFTVITFGYKKDTLLDPLLIRDISLMKDRVKIYYIDGIYDTVFSRLTEIYHCFLRHKGKFEEHKMLGYTPYTTATWKSKVKQNIKMFRILESEKRFVKKGYAIIRKENIRYDLIISSYGDFGDHWLAMKLKRKENDIRWIADYRDPVLRYFWPDFYKKYLNNFISKVARQADAIIGVTPECIDAHSYPEKNIVIPNGFDQEDMSAINVDKKDTKMHICLTGTVYPERRDHFDILYKLLSSLEAEGKINLKDFQIDYAGKYSWFMKKKAKEYGMNQILSDYGYVSREEALKLQKNADILLVLSCNNEGESGVLTGKFLEYMMSEKNILALISGDLDNSIIKRIIKDGNLGFCYEEACHKTDIRLLKNFIINKYEEFQHDGKLSYAPKPEVRERYNYCEIAREVKQIIEKL